MVTKDNCIDSSFHWYNEPQFSVNNGSLTLTTKPRTDFWQRTYYGFRPDNGHCLLTEISSDFLLSVRTTFNPNSQYDQCGLIIRLNEENWIKTSMEYENEKYSRLGSVVTNLGYSDWATQDVDSSIRRMSYKIQSRGKDFLIESSLDGLMWKQMRVAHLHATYDTLSIGIYACSPKQGGFDVTFDKFMLSESMWELEI
jgi:uncharacterized protein